VDAHERFLVCGAGSIRGVLGEVCGESRLVHNFQRFPCLIYVCSCYIYVILPCSCFMLSFCDFGAVGMRAVVKKEYAVEDKGSFENMPAEHAVMQLFEVEL
jgi:hypothetical protein